MLKRFGSWLNSRRQFLFSWYTKDSQETQEPERSLVELPVEWKNKLVDQVESLPSNPAEVEAIVSALDKAFDCWCEDPRNADNSIVILSSPVTAVSRILSETLGEWIESKQMSMRLLPLTARLEDIELTKSKLEHYLKPQCQSSNSGKPESEVVIIPNLSWCFLRSLEGLSGIEYLRSLLCDNVEHRFWIIGSGQVSWEYLHSVCDLEAYCGKVYTLPEIEPEKLQEWLEPIVKDLNLTFDEPRIDKQLLEGEEDHQTHYFERLSSISRGVSTIAVQGFLKSIYYEEEETDPDDLTSKPQNLVAQVPKLPDLPLLKSVDQYLLYSFLLHGDLSIHALAESLGDDEAQVQARVQILRRQGIVEQQGQVLKINPIYYPQVKQELASNNFIINRE